MRSFNKNHTYVICAYKESGFLKECIESLKKQTVQSNIIMVTSTPNEFIEGIAKEYELPLYVNDGKSGIVEDWNFGYSKATTEYITIAHQDDVYLENYTEHMMEKMQSAKQPLIGFTNYCELRNGEFVKNNKILKVKRLLLTPLKIKCLQNSIFVRRRVLSLGCSICCPSVTFAVKNLPNPVFTPGFRSDEDWEAWEKLSKLKGQFIYDDQILMAHRIHEESETSIILGDNARSQEDYIMFCKFWPKSFAKWITKKYSVSEQSNDVK